MPRDGSGVYSVPPGTPAVSNETIDSGKYNGFLGDLVTDLNAARPITSGGTGATSDEAARSALGLKIGVDIPSYLAVRNFLSGLTISNNVADAVNDIDIAAGCAMDSTNTILMALSAPLTKRLDAPWAAGSGNGGRFSGAAAADTTYHLYQIRNPTTGDVDGGFSGNASDPRGGANYPAAFTQFRRIGSVIRSGGTILGFVQEGDRFMLKVPRDLQAGGLTTAAVLYTAQVPLGIRVLAHTAFKLSSSTLSTFFYGLITDLSLTDSVPSVNNAQISLKTPATAGVYVESTALDVMTDTSGQVRARVSNGDSNCTLTLTTYGWTDRRGKD